MHNNLARLSLCLLLSVCVFQRAAWAVCPPPATPQNCASIAFCSTPKEDNNAFKDVDKGFVKKLNSVYKDIMTSIDNMDALVASAISSYSGIMTHLSQDYVDNIKKAMEVSQKKRQEFLQQQNTLEALQLAKPSKAFVQEGALKSMWPTTEALTRAMRQELYSDHTKRTELMSENFYRDRTNIRERAYNSGTIAGIAKLYETHTEFFCNAAGAQKPPGCGEKAAVDETGDDKGAAVAQGVKMGDQMMEIYLGDRTWPKNQVQKAIELMQFYLGITPPDLPMVSDLNDASGQRAYIAYQGKLAKNNFLTYIISYLVAKRSPSNQGQASFVAIRKEASGCDNETSDNKQLCHYLDDVLAKGKESSRAELSRALEYDRFMTPAYITKTISGTLGIEKDLTLLMMDRLQQDYEEYQMDKMITASMAGYYANLVNPQ